MKRCLRISVCAVAGTVKNTNARRKTGMERNRNTIRVTQYQMPSSRYS